MIDGGSTDGTRAAVAKNFPQVVFHSAPGTWWCSGMRILMELAAKEAPDWIILANDDSDFYPGAIRRACEFAKTNGEQVCVGNFDQADGRLSYGGQNPVSKLRPLTLKLETEGICKTWNANFVFVPRVVYQSVGLFSGRYLHNTGDNDYGFRVSMAGLVNLVIPGSLGVSVCNASDKWWLNYPNWQKRWSASQHPKALPWRERLHYSWTYGGFMGLLVFVKIYLEVFFPALADLLPHAEKKVP